jgi:hypothetical protein
MSRYRVAIGRNLSSLTNKFSIGCLAGEVGRSNFRGCLRLAFGGIAAVFPAAASGLITLSSAPTQVMGFATGRMKTNRIAESINQGMDFDAQAAARPPDRLVHTDFFWAPALC